MMAAEAGGEEGGAGAGGAAATGSGTCPAAASAAPACRAKIPGPAEAGATAGSGFLGGGAAAGSGLSAAAVAAFAAAAALPPGPAAAGDPAAPRGATPAPPAETCCFPPLPPPPPPPLLPALGAGLGPVDEGDSLDGPEYEEEEVAIPLTAPPTNQWYHGKLDRTIAEERLRQAGKSGSYLIRESDRRPGSFVLSFLSQTNVVNHFR